MASAEIDSGICGFCTTVRTTMEGRAVKLEFDTTCGRPPHLVGLIRPVAVRHLVDAEKERNRDEMSEA